MKFGNTIQGIFDLYRNCIDVKLNELGLSNHFKEIEDGLLSDNPESWRTAVFECRNVLEDVSKYLWKDPKTTYKHLPGKGPGGKLKVTEHEPLNRISAYLHQKGFSGSRTDFLRDEVERLATSIRSLYRYQSKAHSQTQQHDALTIALATYFILGELVLKTDMQPVEQYGQPSPIIVSGNQDM